MESVIEEIFDGANIPIKEAAQIMNKSEQYIRQGLIQKVLPIGIAIKLEGSNQYSYYISPKKFYEYTGYKKSSH